MEKEAEKFRYLQDIEALKRKAQIVQDALDLQGDTTNQDFEDF